jgi:hypothetical protein
MQALLKITRRHVTKTKVSMKLRLSNLITMNTRNPTTLNDEASECGYKTRKLERIKGEGFFQK